MVSPLCTHCLTYSCQVVFDAGFVSCSGCGKVLGEVRDREKTASKSKSNIKITRNIKSSRFKRSKRKRATPHMLSMEQYVVAYPNPTFTLPWEK